MVASDESEREPLVRAAEACDGADVAVAESFATARDRIDGDESACVAIGDVEEGLIEFLSSIEPDVPILYCPMDGDERTVAAAAAAGAGYVPRVDGLHDRLVNAMTDAVETYQERWVSATESTILDTMLSDLDVALYAKDERARHVKVADIKGGVPPGEQYGKTDREIFGDDHPFDSDETYRDDMRVIETGEPIREKIQHHGEEVPIWLRTTKVPLRDEDGPITGLVGISVDVTELKARIGALERRIERLEHFVSHAHHDLKNPLQVASGFLEIAREQDDDEVALEKIQGLSTGWKRCSTTSDRRRRPGRVSTARRGWCRSPRPSTTCGRPSTPNRRRSTSRSPTAPRSGPPTPMFARCSRTS
ncbi:PAS domain-containing protein [Halosimplex aquaticum]